MISIKVNIGSLKGVFGDLEQMLADPSDLNVTLGERLESDLSDYFVKRNQQPNKRGWNKRDWWAKVANDMNLLIESNGARLIINEPGFALRLFGGVVRPKTAKALTIPLTEKAYLAERASEFPGELFRPRGTNILATEDGDDFEAHYALVKKTTHEPDDEALPKLEDLEKMLAEETSNYVKNQFRN